MDSGFGNITTRSSITGNNDDGGGGGHSISLTERIVVITMLAILSVVGTVGNALAIYVFASLKQKLTSTIFILTLAGTDFITCLITIPFTITMEYLEYHVTVDAVCKIYHFLITTTVPFSCVVIVAIAVDRYMCICHPFHHWMTIQRARIIIGALAFFIFMCGGIICMHYTIYKDFTHAANVTTTSDYNTTSPPDYYTFSLNSTSYITRGGAPEYSNTVVPYSLGPSHTPDPAYKDVSVRDTPPTEKSRTATKTVNMPTSCDMNEEFLDRRFMAVFRKLYSGIFLVSCIIVLVLYSLIYRSVIAQRRKKLRIKSAQCCLLWNATSVDPPPETAEMTQDIELSHVNGEDRFNTRLNSGTAEDLEAQNNGAVRKCSLSKARIERMRVANIKTAFTLFIVTLVFILAFLPAWLMALRVVAMQVVVFYMYFVYNVVNPFIYAFLNQNFKTELRRILRCGKQ